MDSMYIKMCEGAWNDIGYIVPEYIPNKVITNTNGKEILELRWTPKLVNEEFPVIAQLYRQVQLQEMLTGDGLNKTYCSAVSAQGNKTYKYGFKEITLVRTLLNKFHHWVNTFEYPYPDALGKPFKFRPLQIFDSLEKL